MSEEKNKISVVFRIAGSGLDVAALNSLLAGIAGKVVSRPDNVPASVLPEAWWAIEVVQRDQESTETVIAETLDALEPLQSEIRKIACDPRFQIELDCTIEINEERPVMEVSSGTLRRLADIGVTLGFEVYDYQD